MAFHFGVASTLCNFKKALENIPFNAHINATFLVHSSVCCGLIGIGRRRGTEA